MITQQYAQQELIIKTQCYLQGIFFLLGKQKQGMGISVLCHPFDFHRICVKNLQRLKPHLLIVDIYSNYVQVIYFCPDWLWLL